MVEKGAYAEVSVLGGGVVAGGVGDPDPRRGDGLHHSVSFSVSFSAC